MAYNNNFAYWPISLTPEKEELLPTHPTQFKP